MDALERVAGEVGTAVSRRRFLRTTVTRIAGLTTAMVGVAFLSPERASAACGIMCYRNGGQCNLCVDSSKYLYDCYDACSGAHTQLCHTGCVASFCLSTGC